MGKESVEESLGPLQATKRDVLQQGKLQEDEITRQKKLLEDIQAEVDLFIGAYLKQETLEKEKKDQFDDINQQMEDMQKELKQLKEEEHHWLSHFKTLAGHRE